MRFLILLIGFGFLSADGFTQSKTIVKDTVPSDTFEIQVLDPGFMNWCITRARPRGFYGLPYLETQNRFMVAVWNSRAYSGQRPYGFPIDYDPNIRYGYEVNWTLFNYFLYFQEVTGERLGIRLR